MEVIGQFQSPAALPLVKKHLVSIDYEVEGTPEPGWAL